MRRLLLLAGPILLILLIVGIGLSAAGQHNPRHSTVIVLKPHNVHNTTSHTSTSSGSKQQWIRVPLANGVLTFYTTQLTQFQVSGSVVKIGFVGQLVLGEGTYILYNVSNCHISGNMEIIRMFENGIEIHVYKTVTITDCDYVVIRVT